jgi:hypothetical protein
MTRRSQFVSLGLAQLAGRVSLRDVVSNLKAQASKLYHLGCGDVNRSSLARVNEQQPHDQALFGKLMARCQALAPKHRFRFKNKLYSLDASTIAGAYLRHGWKGWCRDFERLNTGCAREGRVRPPRGLCVSLETAICVQPFSNDTFSLWSVPGCKLPGLLRVVRRLPVEYLRTPTGLRLGAGVLQPLTETAVHIKLR